MKRKCERCGKEFEARMDFHKLCPACFRNPQKAKEFPPELLLASYYDNEGQLVKDVFIGTPEKLALFFANDTPPLATKQLRNFNKIISKARKKAMLQGISSAKPMLYKCLADIEYQHNRKVVPQSFLTFMKHHLKQTVRETPRGASLQILPEGA